MTGNTSWTAGAFCQGGNKQSIEARQGSLVGSWAQGKNGGQNLRLQCLFCYFQLAVSTLLFFPSNNSTDSPLQKTPPTPSMGNAIAIFPDMCVCKSCQKSVSTRGRNAQNVNEFIIIPNRESERGGVKWRPGPPNFRNDKTQCPF